MYVLKEVKLESVNILKKLMIDTFKQAYKDMHTKENIDIYCEKTFTSLIVKDILTSNIYTTVIAYKEDLPVGFLVTKNKSCPFKLDANSLELQRLYILRSEYNKGLGQVLFNYAIKISKDKLVKYIWLYASNTNDRAHFFYEKVGFEKKGKGKEFMVGKETLNSSIMVYKI